MTLRPCPCEKEVSELLARGQWPGNCVPELRAHVSGCRSCRDLVLLTETFRRTRAETLGAARLASPGALWWKAQLRRRNAAVERVGKPILSAQIFALAINLCLVVGLLAWQARRGLGWLTWLEQLPQATTLHLGKLWPSALLNSGLSLTVLIPAAATLALLSGVVVYLASEKQ
ncbi:MAG: hypothetical protein ABSE87_03975 [Terracidiphilus sp.]|jgi:hypothetical protein